MQTVEVTLPGGIAVGGAWHRTALLRPVCGRDEAFLAEEARALLPAQRITSLLTRLLERCGPCAPVTPELVRALSVGDREALLLHLRRLTLGENISCVLTCPREACGQRMDLELRVSDLLVPPYGYEPREVHETVVEGGGRSFRVRFRLPNGGDQEAAAAHAFEGLDAAEEVLLRRCVQSSTVCGEGEAGEVRLPPEAAHALQDVMAALDVQAEVVLHVTCPSCGLAFGTPFDTADYFFRELKGWGTDVFREVHLLALHYHWSEAEIMSMSRRRRRLYLGLLADSGGRF